MERTLKTLNHIINTVRRYCIVKHFTRIYEAGDLMIIDVMLVPFLDRVRQRDGINQVSTQLDRHLFAGRFKNYGLFHHINFFDWKVVSGGDGEYDKCFIRCTIYPKPFIGFTYCGKCGAKTGRTYGSRSGTDRNCPNCGFLAGYNCVNNHTDYEVLPEEYRKSEE